jgi:hypothetical protein
MGMDLDRLDAEPYQSVDFDEFDHYIDQNSIAPVLDYDDGDELDEHGVDYGLQYSHDVTGLVDEIWLDSAPPEHFTIEAGYF